MVLDIGCGDNKKEGSIGCDCRMTDSTDAIADARLLPFRDEVFDYVYSSHVIEHFSHREVKDVMTEWVRVLKKDGIVEIVCPWFRVCALYFFLKPNYKHLMDIYGAQGNEMDYHKCGFTFNQLKELLEQCGIINVKLVWWGGGGKLPFIPGSLWVKGVKRC
jgi:predicted SAM-dependent methyltransferase